MKITAAQYREMNKKHATEPAKQVIETVSAAARVAKNAKELAEKSRKLDTVAALKAMGNYFELDAKSVNFWIEQMKLNGRL